MPTTYELSTYVFSFQNGKAGGKGKNKKAKMDDLKKELEMVSVLFPFIKLFIVNQMNLLRQ